MTDYEKIIEMFSHAEIKYTTYEDKSEIDFGVGIEFYFDDKGSLIGMA